MLSLLDILIAKPLKEYLADQSGSVDNDKVQKEFAKIQKSLKSHGYQAKSVNDIYHDARKSYYYIVVDGGKQHYYLGRIASTFSP